MTRRLEVTRMIPASPARVADAFWDIEAWQRVWDPISAVTVGYCDGRGQEFTMRVDRDGRTEEVRTVRWRAHDRIDFFSPTAPPMMTWHRGSWIFAAAHGGCAVTAIREYQLAPDPAGTTASEDARADRFHDGFTTRVAAILDCFAAAFARPGPPGTTGADADADIGATDDDTAVSAPGAGPAVAGVR